MPASRQPLALAPAALTLGNALAGFWAVAVLAGLGGSAASMDRFELAAALIAAAMVCDALDGFAARATKTASALGARLDALADAVSFGVAPAMLVLTLGHAAAAAATPAGRRAALAVAMIYLAGALLRLARFQVERPGDTSTAEEHPRSFRGLPSPAAGGVVITVALALGPTWLNLDAAVVAVGTAAAALGVSGLMVSRLRYPHAVTAAVRRRARFGQVALLGFVLACVAVEPAGGAVAAALVYAAWGPVSAVERRLRRRRPTAAACDA